MILLLLYIVKFLLSFSCYIIEILLDMYMIYNYIVYIYFISFCVYIF